MNNHQSQSRTCGFGFFLFAVANETYPLMRTIPSLKEKPCSLQFPPLPSQSPLSLESTM
nr:MAG TPA: hypothetical protein [Caudoviricetes sp.]